MTESTRSRCLMIFAKPPLPGRVKTRLAATIGSRAALSVYRQLLTDTVVNLAHSGPQALELWSAGGPHPALTALARRNDAVCRSQARGDLGWRMRCALDDVLHRERLPVLVGADCTGVTPGHVQAAFVALEDGADAVFAPTPDGGYALVGVARTLPRLFRCMPWGSSRVMAHTRRRLKASGCRWVELAGAWDVDDYSDLRRWRRLRARHLKR